MNVVYGSPGKPLKLQILYRTTGATTGKKPPDSSARNCALQAFSPPTKSVRLTQSCTS